ncbi:MAG TPA: hypothetical protein VFE46_18775 [Pirellulales bacterium]|nr:hypothetical protein [Pirellulales bacterium]
MAEEIGKAAEHYRHDLAIMWLGAAMPNWSQPCPIHADVAPNLGAGGATSFVFDRGEVFDWDMKIQGSEERILDSVLPHEVTHTIFATYFRRPLPRWADEGACTTVEHTSEKNKQQVMLVNFLRTDHGIAFDKLFAMKDYPHDVLPLYSEGYSLARYLIEQGGRPRFLEFVGNGMKTENWPATTKKYYGYSSLQVLQDEWLDWVKQGSPRLIAQNSGNNPLETERLGSLDKSPIYRAQSDDRESSASFDPAVERRLVATSSASSSPSLQEQGWEPISRKQNVLQADGPQQSVYERTSTSDSPLATAIKQREPVYVAQRDQVGSVPAGGTQKSAGQGHQVLLQWTLTE